MFRKTKQKNVKISLNDVVVQSFDNLAFEQITPLKKSKFTEKFTDRFGEDDTASNAIGERSIHKITQQSYVERLLANNNDELIEIFLSTDGPIQKDPKDVSALNEAYGKIQKSFLICEESSTHEDCVIHWKVREDEEFFTLSMSLQLEREKNAAVHKFVKDFLSASLEMGHSGIAKSESKNLQRTELKLSQLADLRGYNLLFFAAEQNSVEIVENLFSLGFTVNDEINKETAADIAWKNKNYDFLLILLKNNSCMPKSLNMYEGTGEELPQDLRDFFRLSMDMTKAVQEGNTNQIEKFIEEHPGLTHFYSLVNVSAAKESLKCKNLLLYEFLLSKNIIFGPLESTNTAMDALSGSDREKLRKIHTKLSKNLPEQHINVLIANSHLGHDIDKVEEKRKYIEEAFYFLNSIALVQILLRCVAASKKFSITFDFNRDNVQFLDPTMDTDADGLFDLNNGQLSIGAKQMLDPATKHEVFAIIAHELCHYSMSLAYRNYANPYKSNDSRSRKKFEKISLLCMRYSKQEPVVDGVYELYQDLMWHAELIVRIPHMLVLYHSHPEKLQKLQRMFKPLFDYYETKVVKDLEKAVPEISRRAEEKVKRTKRENFYLRIFLLLLIILVPLCIYFLVQALTKVYSWDELSSGEKNEIKNSHVDFQGQSVLMKLLVDENDEDAFRSLTPEVIENFLKNGEKIKVGHVWQMSEKFFIERKFRNHKNRTMSMSELVEDVGSGDFNEMFFFDIVGSGKTVAVQKLSQMLKETYPHKWVLDGTSLVTSECEISEKDLEHPSKLLSKRLTNATDFERLVLKRLFEQGNVVIIWDGIRDQGLFECFFLRLREYVKSYARNVQLMVFRGKLLVSYVEEGEYAVEFVPYDNKNREEFLYAYALIQNFTALEIVHLHEELSDFIERMKSNDAATRDINNPSMLKVILGQANVRKFEQLNLYKIFEDVFESKSKTSFSHITDEEILCIGRSEKNPLHQKYAMQFLFNNSFYDVAMDTYVNLSSLDIMSRNYQLNKSQIHSYGIVDASRSFNEEENSDVEFIYDSFISFFVAQYFVENIFHCDFNRDKEEKILRLKLFFHVMSDEKYHAVHKFISEYLALGRKPKPMARQLKTIKKYFSDIFSHLLLADDSLEPIESVSEFFHHEKEIIDTLWRINDDESYFIWYFKESRNDNVDELLTLARNYFKSEAELERLTLGYNQIGSILLSMALLKHDKPNFVKFYADKLSENGISATFITNVVHNLPILSLLKTTKIDLNATEVILRNGYALAQHYATQISAKREKEFDKVYDLLLNDESKKRLLHSIDWKTGNTILHLFASNEATVPELRLNWRNNLSKKLLLTQNRKERDTSFTVAVKSLASNSLKIFNSAILIFKKDMLEKLLEVRNVNQSSLLETSLLNSDSQVFHIIANAYIGFNQTDVIKEDKNGSLALMFESHFKHTEAIFDDMMRVMNATYAGNVTEARRHFASNDTEFVELVRRLAVPENKHHRIFKNFTQFLNISDAESEKMLELDTALAERSSSDENVVERVKNFANEHFNIYSSKNSGIANTFANDPKIYEIVADVMNSTSENFTNLYAIFDAYVTMKMREDFSESELESKKAHQLLAITKITESTAIKEEFEQIKEENQTLLDNSSLVHEKFGAYQFKYDGMEFFFAAQFFIENIYNYSDDNDTLTNTTVPLVHPANKLLKSERIDYEDEGEEDYEDYEDDNSIVVDDILKAKTDALMELWSKTSNENEPVIYLMSDYIENDDIKKSFSIYLKNIFLAYINSDEEVTCFEGLNIVAVLRSLSLFIRKDEEVLEKLWVLNNQTGSSELFSALVTVKPHDFERLLSIAAEVFPPLDFATVTNLTGKEGIMLHYLYRVQKHTLCNLESYRIEELLKILNLDTDSLTLKDLQSKSSHIEFFNCINDVVGETALENLLVKSPDEFLFPTSFDMSLVDADFFWTRTSEILGEERIRNIASNLNNWLKARLIFITSEIRDVRFLQQYLERLKKLFTEADLHEMLWYRDSSNDSSLNNLMYEKKNLNFLKTFWNFSDIFLNETQKQEQLSLSNHKNYTALFMSIVHYKAPDVFDFVKELYSSHFNTTELQLMFLNVSHSVISKITSEEMAKSVADFLFEIFNDDREKLLEYLGQKEDDMTIFQLGAVQREILTPFIDKAESLFGKEEAKSMLKFTDASSWNLANRNIHHYDGGLDPYLLKTLLG